ncbi:MAG TPA: hypothetical protein VHB97_11580 [Polyangia bacterium]|nr:hypothetical protein [Polyangia bacterium]
MSRALVIALLSILFAGSTAALWLGVEEAELARIGHRADYAAEELQPSTRGYVAVFGCVRHDLAVATTSDGQVYALGGTAPGGRTAEQSEADRVFTPLSARDDCEEGRAPKKIYALVEDDDALGNTIGRVYKTKVAPPPVPAFAEGVIGYGAGSRLLARHAADKLQIDLGKTPLLAKGRHPGVLWVALVTAAAGLHGYALIVVVILWSRRRARRAAARSHFSDEENEFYESDDPA